MAHPIKQPARSRKFAFAITCQGKWCWSTSELFCLVLYHDCNSELCCEYEKYWFGQSVRRWISSTLGWKRFEYTWIAQHAALATSPHCKLENHLVFYFNLLLIVYLLCSIKSFVFYRSLVCFHLVINFIITVCRPQHQFGRSIDQTLSNPGNHKHKFRFQDTVYLKLNKRRVKIWKKYYWREFNMMCKTDETMLFLYSATNCPTEAEKKTHDELIIDFGGQKRNKYNSISFLYYNG